jgi:mRNA interferase MazF
MKQLTGENLLAESSGRSIYVPDRGDIIYVNFDPQAGREQKKRRPAIVLSPLVYNNRFKLALLCPITSKIKNYPFEINLPKNMKISGVILVDQIKSMDWNARYAEFIEKSPEYLLREIVLRLQPLLPLNN